MDCINLDEDDKCWGVMRVMKLWGGYNADS